MTLDEAIEHCRDKAENSHCECGEQHRQLMEWLIELKERRRNDDLKYKEGFLRGQSTQVC